MMDQKKLKDAAPAPRRFRVSRWWDDPYSRGAWSMLRVGASAETRRQIGEPVSDRLTFAGEATHATQAAMTHGAFEEGVRAARWCAEKGHKRTIVVGAGFAGIGAALELGNLGISTIVLEARDRIGGRVHSNELNGATVELGANWLQQGDRNPLRAIAQSTDQRLITTDFNAPLDLGPPEVLALLADRKTKSAIEEKFSNLAPPDKSIADVLDSWLREHDAPPAQAVRHLVDLEILLDSGVSLHNVSATNGWEPGVGEGDYWLANGYGQLVSRMAAALDIRKCCPIQNIYWLGPEIIVSGPIGVFSADAVIVTVPVAVLQAGGINFEPALPESLLEAFRLIATGRVEKVALQFDERWWPVSPSGYLRTLDGRPGMVSEWLDLTDVVAQPTITGTFAGDWAGEIWASGGDAAVAQSATSALYAAVMERR